MQRAKRRARKVDRRAASLRSTRRFARLVFKGRFYHVIVDESWLERWMGSARSVARARGDDASARRAAIARMGACASARCASDREPSRDARRRRGDCARARARAPKRARMPTRWLRAAADDDDEGRLTTTTLFGDAGGAGAGRTRARARCGWETRCTPRCDRGGRRNRE